MFNFAGSIFITKFVQLIKGKLSKVATSGSYNDLSDKPTIPDVSSFMTKENPTGSGSFSINRQAGSTVGTNSATFGSNNVAEGENSVASGENSIASGKNQIVIGENNETDDDSILIAGNGYITRIGQLIRCNAFWLKKNGDGYFTGDVYAKDPTVPSSESYTPVIRLARTNEIPTSLPANGGNADTLDGKHASDFAIIKSAWIDVSTSADGTGYIFDDNAGTPLVVHCASLWHVTCTISHNNVYGGWGVYVYDFYNKIPYQGVISVLVYYI